MSKKTQDEVSEAPVSAALKAPPEKHFSQLAEGKTRRELEPMRAMFAAASVLHGWPTQQEADELGLSFSLTRDDYLKAIEAVDKFKPHPAAVSTHKKG